MEGVVKLRWPQKQLLQRGEMIIQMNRGNITDMENMFLASVAEKTYSQSSELNRDSDDDESTISPEETNPGNTSASAAKKRKRHVMTEEQRREER